MPNIELSLDPDALTDAQLAAGVAALRQVRAKFNNNATDMAIVYAVVYAVATCDSSASKPKS